MDRLSLTEDYGDLFENVWSGVRARYTDAGPSERMPLAHFEDDPHGFARHIREKHWVAQRVFCDRVLEKRLIHWRAGRKVGKTHSLAFLVEWFMQTAPTVCVSFAPTQSQVRDNLWSHINELHARAKRISTGIVGECDAMQLRIGPRHFAIGRATREGGNVIGFHAGVTVPDDPDAEVTKEQLETIQAAAKAAGDSGARLLMIYDEAQKMHREVYDVMVGSLSGPNTYIVLAGNPILSADTDHPFASIARQVKSPWWRMKTPSCDETLWTDRPDPIQADEVTRWAPTWLVAPDWPEQRANEWRVESPNFQAYVLARYPENGGDGARIVTARMLDAAEAREGWHECGPHIGIDLSRSLDGDECVASYWFDGVPVEEYVWRSPDLMVSVDEILALLNRWKWADETGREAKIPGSRVHVDVTGLGGGVVDRLRQLGVWVDAVDFGGAPANDWPHLMGETVLYNRRAELHWIFRRVLEEGLAHIPKSFSTLRQQATWPRLADAREGSRGSDLRVQPKEEIRALYGRSPDRLDAALLAWARTGGEPRIFTFGR